MPSQQTLASTLRKQLGSLTQVELATKLDVTPSRLSRWLRGETLPADKAVPELAERLGVPADKLQAIVTTDRKRLAALNGKQPQRESVSQRLDRIEQQLDVLLSLFRDDD